MVENGSAFLSNPYSSHGLTLLLSDNLMLSSTRCRANSAHVKQPEPDSGPGFQVKVLNFLGSSVLARRRTGQGGSQPDVEPHLLAGVWQVPHSSYTLDRGPSKLACQRWLQIPSGRAACTPCWSACGRIRRRSMDRSKEVTLILSRPE